MPAGISIFIVSLIAVFIVRFLEISVGIDHGFHPDSLHYIEFYHIFTTNKINSLSSLNNGYYYVVSFFNGDVNSLIIFNQFIFAVTNVLIFKIFGNKYNNLKLIQYIILFLPYRLHLSAHVLKDTIIIFLILCTYYASLRSFPIFVLLTSLFRVSVAPIVIAIRFTPKRRIYMFIGILILLIMVSMIPELSSFLLDRSEADMGGREYFDVPFSNASGFLELFVKATLWPTLAKTGFFSVVSPHPVTIAISLEPIILTAWAVYHRRLQNYLFENGVLAMVIIALLVTSFGAYYRYVYPFMILDYILMAKRYMSNRSKY